MAARTGWFRVVLLFWALVALVPAYIFIGDYNGLLPLEMIDVSPCKQEREDWEQSKRVRGDFDIHTNLMHGGYLNCVAEKGEDRSMLRYQTERYQSGAKIAFWIQTIWAVMIWGVYGIVCWIITGFRRRETGEREK